MEITKEKSVGLLKKWLSFSGRATRKDFWMTALWQFLTTLAVFVLIAVVQSIIRNWFGTVLCIPFFIAVILLIIAGFANGVRRLHDLGLSGFWIFYLTAFGLPSLYFAYLMDADASAKATVERIKGVGSPWLSWILAIIFWPLACGFGSLLILLSPGQKQDNLYGPNPYEVA